MKPDRVDVFNSSRGRIGMNGETLVVYIDRPCQQQRDIFSGIFNHTDTGLEF